MRRLVLDAVTPDAQGDQPLEARASHYVTHVLRLAAGQSIEVTDGSGSLWQGRLAWREGAAWIESLARVQQATPGTPIVLAAALLKQARWDWLLEKAAELGVAEIRPITAARSIVKIEAREAADRAARWQRICDAALQQSGGLVRTVVHPPTTLAQVLKASADGSLSVVADERLPLARWPEAPDAERIVVYAGPEGGWTDPERATLADAGVQGIGLGQRILRAETAGLALLAGWRLRLDGLL